MKKNEDESLMHAAMNKLCSKLMNNIICKNEAYYFVDDALFHSNTRSL